MFPFLEEVIPLSGWILITSHLWFLPLLPPVTLSWQAPAEKDRVGHPGHSSSLSARGIITPLREMNCIFPARFWVKECNAKRCISSLHHCLGCPGSANSGLNNAWVIRGSILQAPAFAPLSERARTPQSLGVCQMHWAGECAKLTPRLPELPP